MNPKPIISVCIPTYNRAPFLREALNSIMPQVDDTVEVIIFDNASQDDTQEVVKTFQQRYHKIEYFKNEENVGFDRNILLCLHRAMGDYVWFFGDDDILLEGAIEYIKSIIKRMGEVSLIYLNYYGFKTDWREKDYLYIQVAHDIYFNNPNECLNLISSNLGFMSALVLNRRECLRVEGIAEYINSGFIHLYITLQILLSRRPIVLVAHHYIAQKAGNSGDFDVVRVFTHEFHRVLWGCRRKGYGWWPVYKTAHNALWGLILVCLSQKCIGKNLITRLNIMSIFKTCWIYPLFWFGIIPIFFLPRFCVSLIYKSGHFTRSLRPSF